MNENTKREIDSLITDVIPSQIPPEPRPQPQEIVMPDINRVNALFWEQKTRELGNDFLFGSSIAKFGSNDLSTRQFFVRVSEAFKNTIVHECEKNNLSSENFKLHLQALDSILLLIAKEIENKNFSKYTPESLIAALHGFFSTFGQRYKP